MSAISSSTPPTRKALQARCRQEVAAIDIEAQIDNLRAQQKRMRKGAQMKQAANVRLRVFEPIRPTSEPEMRVANRVVVAGTLLNETLGMLAALMRAKLKQERCGDGRTIRLGITRTIWDLLRDLLQARGGTVQRWNHATLTDLAPLRSLFHISRLGYAATLRKFADSPLTDVAYFWVSPHYPMSFAFSPVKGLAVTFYFQYIDPMGLPLTSTLR